MNIYLFFKLNENSWYERMEGNLCGPSYVEISRTPDFGSSFGLKWKKIKDFFYSISNQDHNHVTSRSEHMGDRALETCLICVNPLEVLYNREIFLN